VSREGFAVSAAENGVRLSGPLGHVVRS
jgi:hypothetical protein